MQTAKVINLKQTSYEIHDEAMSAAKDLKSNYLRLFEVLMKVESRQIYYDLELPSLYIYCVEMLELSNHVSHDFVTVIRKVIEVPELAAAIRRGKLTITKARRICSAISANDFKQWIDLAESCTSRVIEKAVALANPRSASSETMKYLAEDLLEFKLPVDEEWKNLLAETKDILSQQRNKAVTSEEALRSLMKDFVSKNSAVDRAKRSKAKRAEAKSAKVNRNIPAEVEHQVNLRDHAQCTFIDRHGKRCESRRWLQFHHVKHFSDGGAHELENLRTLCWAHHRITHLREQKNRHVPNEDLEVCT